MFNQKELWSVFSYINGAFKRLIFLVMYFIHWPAAAENMRNLFPIPFQLFYFHLCLLEIQVPYLILFQLYQIF